MDNIFQVSNSKFHDENHERILKKLYPKNNPFRTQQYALNSINRTNNWSKEQSMNNQTITTLGKGAIPLLHEDHHDFRGRDKDKELSKQDFYHKHYLPDKLKAEEAYQTYKSLHLESSPYKNTNIFTESTRSPDKEIDTIMRFKERTEEDRIHSHLNGTNRLIDFTERNNKMLISPSWKDNHKTKWTSPKNFHASGCHVEGKRSQDPWPMIPPSTNVGVKYIDGFEVLGDVSRKRNKKLEISTKDFISTVSPMNSPRTYSYLPLLNSTSIRSSKSMDFFKTHTTSPKIYANSLRQVVEKKSGDSIDYVKTESPHATKSPKFKFQHSNSPLATLKESMYTPRLNKKINGLSSPTSELNRSFRQSSLFNSKKFKDWKAAHRDEYIRQTIKTYFD